MGLTFSKAKQQLQFKTLACQNKAPPCSTKTEIPSPSLVQCPNRSIPRARKSKQRRHHPVGKVSVKRSKPKYKKVTKSIIGKPTNFKHTGHMGAGDILESSVDTMALSNELNGIANQINCFDSRGPIKQVKQDDRIQVPLGISSLSRPPPPPHLYISASAKKRASKHTASPRLPPVVPVSFQRRQYRKAVSRHHPNLGLVNALMIEIPTLHSITVA